MWVSIHLINFTWIGEPGSHCNIMPCRFCPMRSSAENCPQGTEAWRKWCPQRCCLMQHSSNIRRWEGGSTQRGSSLQAFAVLVAVCDIAVSAASVLCSFPLTPVTWSTSGYSYRPHKCGFCKRLRQGEMERIWETVHGTGHSVTSGLTGDGGGEKMGLHWGCPIQ